MDLSADCITSYTRDGLVFDVHDAGPVDGTLVLLLHGFPQDSRSWGAVSPLLHARGYRTIAPDQRGYSPGARPRSRRTYRPSELVKDIVGLNQVVGLGPVHLVGHDWGAAVAWQVAAQRPDLLRSLTALSVPHPAAFLRAMGTRSQRGRSRYMLFFQLPWLLERQLSSGKSWERLLRSTGMSPQAAARDAERMRDCGAARAALNWYRAIVFTRGAEGCQPLDTGRSTGTARRLVGKAFRRESAKRELSRSVSHPRGDASGPCPFRRGVARRADDPLPARAEVRRTRGSHWWRGAEYFGSWT